MPIAANSALHEASAILKSACVAGDVERRRSSAFGGFSHADEISAQDISASGRKHCHSAAPVARCFGA